ncbi:putative FAD-dependent oxidoreductase domain-containing protein 2-like [Apostichopus japonicus]|uniref:Putative FAD-dependent oxidoreductase domain-containing protein 2-like n=1 Tax=Stichopus japonicus TaxID=307972 RepID=A0A2G8LBR9_STIJA|nr:putative FAD-dependent oxidoreductase domain-containing protein 2-like [Apostichopus japonicus]
MALHYVKPHQDKLACLYSKSDSERNGLDYEYLEEFPLKMVHRLPEMTGRSGSQYIIISMEYGKHFSGPGEDIFRSERATGDPQEAHVSNFLHPVLYYYKTLPDRGPNDEFTHR